MTIYESFKSKNIDELVEWLDKYCIDIAPWIIWFDENYCKKCDEIYHENEEDYAWCEPNGVCRFFKDMDDIPDNKQIIKLWLESEI